MPERMGDRCAYCVFCRTGAEAQLGREIEARYERVRALVAMQEKHRTREGIHEVARRVFLPGYLFLYSEEPLELSRIRGMENVYRVLDDIDGAVELRGSDLAFAQWLWDNEGIIGISSVRFAEGGCEILSGPMQTFAERIVRLNKHTKNALVRMDFLGRTSEIWLAFEFADEERGRKAT